MTAGPCSWRWMACAALAALAIAMAPSLGYAQRDQQSEQTKPWSLDDALPANSPAAQSQKTKTAPAKRVQSKPDTEKPALGRLPLSNGAGSFGIETETKVKTTAFPDGRPAPGVETTQRRPPSYFGLSISVPTFGK